MCGIWLTLQSGNEEAFWSMKSRGPDASALYVEDGFRLGFHRLAIHDTSILGMQPFTMADDKSNYFLLCNGEIYNHLELLEHGYTRRSASDCEILLPLFLHLNKDMNLFLKAVHGEFSVILIEQDRSTKKLVSCWAASDPMGVRPLFYSMDSEGRLTGMSSLVKGLSSLETVIRHDPATWLFYSENTKLVVVHGIPDRRGVNIPIAIHDQQKMMLSTLREAVMTRLHADRPLGCLLSGGLDSSLVAAMAARELRKSDQVLRTFSIGMKEATDLHYARLVSRHIGSEHTEFIITEEEAWEAVREVIRDTETHDITTIRASVPQWLLGKKIREQTDIRVVLNGDGADECMMGYLYFHKAPSIAEAIQERDRLLSDIHLFDGLRADRCMSCHGLEPRMPYLHSRFVSFCRTIDGERLVPTSRRQEKNFIREAVHKHTPDLLPLDVLWRKKEAFSDGISPLRRSWFQILQDRIHMMDPDLTEKIYYENLFLKYFPNHQSIIPYHWMPRWTTTTDPSARTLDIYNL